MDSELRANSRALFASSLPTRIPFGFRVQLDWPEMSEPIESEGYHIWSLGCFFS